MRVALDATPLTLTSGGLARYTLQLSLALARSFPQDEYFLISDQSVPACGNLPENLHQKAAPRQGMERRWWLWGVYREQQRLGTEVFHGTDFAVPYLPLRPSVMTVHDLSPWMDPGWHAGAGRVRRRTPWLLRLKLATMVITPSEAVRRQAIAAFGLDPQRIVSTPLAADSSFHPVPPNTPSRPYFLFVGTLEPRKNIHLLVQAWRTVREECGIGMVVAGRRRRDFPGLPEEPGLTLAGEVPDCELPALYSGALAFVYPSLYEGFGLPVLEAMQCGVCVVTSTDAAIQEVCGDAAIRLDPGDVRAWVEALRACATGGEWIGNLRRRALERARDFSWEKTARLTRDVYVEAQRRFHG